MTQVLTRHVGDFTLTLRPAYRSLTMAGRGRVERFDFDEIPAQVRLYRFLVNNSRTGDWYRGDLDAWRAAASWVARIERRAAA